MPRQPKRKATKNTAIVIRNKPQAKKPHRVAYSQEQLPKLSSQVRLSDCADKYLEALTNPFNNISPLPCIPDTLVLPSMKFKVQQRGTFAAGVSGTGFVATAIERTIFADLNSVYSTTTAYNGGQNIVVGSTLIEVIPTASVQSTFTSTSPTVTDGATQFRLVGGGLRVTYSGPNLQMGGNMTIYKSPGQYLVGSVPIALLNSQQTSAYLSVDHRDHAVCYAPDSTIQVSYENVAQFTSRIPSNSFNMIICVSGAPPTVTFLWEMVAYWEVVGTQAVQPTRSHADPVGMGAVISSLPTKIAKSPPKAVHQQTFSETLKTIASTASGVLSILPGPVGMVAKAVNGVLSTQNAMQTYNAPTGPIIENVD